MNAEQVQQAFDETAYFPKLTMWGESHGMFPHSPWFFSHVLMTPANGKEVIGFYAFEHLIGITVRSSSDYNSVDKIWERLYQDMKRTEVFRDLMADEDEELGYEPNISFPEATSIAHNLLSGMDRIYEENEDEELVPGLHSAGFDFLPLEPSRALGDSPVTAKYVLRLELAQALFKARPIFDGMSTTSYGDKYIYYSDYTNHYDVELLTIDDVNENVEHTTGREYFMNSIW